MIKFFRRIRQKLLSENKFSKYLLYAIGEIVLVVIGILIALQINNANEARKSRERELVMLQEILNSINDDLYVYERNLWPLIETKENGRDSLVSYIFDWRPVHDSLISNWYEDMKTDILVRYDDGPFQALNSIGLDLVRTDSLRNIISDAYSSGLPALKAFVDRTVALHDPIIESREQKIMSMQPVLHDNGFKHLHLTPKVDDILANENLLWIINAEQTKLISYKRRLKAIERELIEVKLAIEAELEE